MEKACLLIQARLGQLTRLATPQEVSDWLEEAVPGQLGI
jgi:hypothetical protein